MLVSSEYLELRNKIQKQADKVILDFVVARTHGKKNLEPDSVFKAPWDCLHDGVLFQHELELLIQQPEFKFFFFNTGPDEHQKEYEVTYPKMTESGVFAFDKILTSLEQWLALCVCNRGHAFIDLHLEEIKQWSSNPAKPFPGEELLLLSNVYPKYQHRMLNSILLNSDRTFENKDNKLLNNDNFYKISTALNAEELNILLEQNPDRIANLFYLVKKTSYFVDDCITAAPNIGYGKITTEFLEIQQRSMPLFALWAIQHENEQALPSVLHIDFLMNLFSYCTTQDWKKIVELLSTKNKPHLVMSFTEELLDSIDLVSYSGHCCAEVDQKLNLLSAFIPTSEKLNRYCLLYNIYRSQEIEDVSAEQKQNLMEHLDELRLNSRASQKTSSRWRTRFEDGALFVLAQLLLESDNPLQLQWKITNASKTQNLLHEILLYSLYEHPSLFKTHYKQVMNYYESCSVEQKIEIYQLVQLMVNNIPSLDFETSPPLELNEEKIQEWGHGQWDHSNGGPLMTFLVESTKQNPSFYTGALLHPLKSKHPCLKYMDDILLEIKLYHDIKGPPGLKKNRPEMSPRF